MVRLAAVRPAVNAVSNARAMSVRGMASEYTRFPGSSCPSSSWRTAGAPADPSNSADSYQSSPTTTGR